MEQENTNIRKLIALRDYDGALEKTEFLYQKISQKHQHLSKLKKIAEMSGDFKDAQSIGKDIKNVEAKLILLSDQSTLIQCVKDFYETGDYSKKEELVKAMEQLKIKMDTCLREAPSTPEQNWRYN